MRGGGSARVSFTWLGDAMKVASAAARARRRQVAARVHFLHIMTILHEHRARARMHIYEGAHTSINVQDKLAALSFRPTSLWSRACVSEEEDTGVGHLVQSENASQTFGARPNAVEKSARDVFLECVKQQTIIFVNLALALTFFVAG